MIPIRWKTVGWEEGAPDAELPLAEKKTRLLDRSRNFREMNFTSHRLSIRILSFVVLIYLYRRRRDRSEDWKDRSSASGGSVLDCPDRSTKMTKEKPAESKATNGTALACRFPHASAEKFPRRAVSNNKNNKKTSGRPAYVLFGRFSRTLRFSHVERRNKYVREISNTDKGGRKEEKSQ